MLTFYQTDDKIVNITKNNKNVGGIYYKSQEDINKTSKYQCKYCLRQFIRSDNFKTHLITCKSKLSHEREMQTQSYFKEMKVPNGREEIFELAFPLAKDERLVIFICGRNGSGKSTFIAKILKNYLKVYKNRKIILFSLQEYDDKLDPYFNNIQRVDLGPEFAENPYTLDELRNSICIFDDVDTITDKKLKKAVFDLKDNIMKQGRGHFNSEDRTDDIDIIISNHDILGGKETQTMIRESIFYVIFPKGSTPAQIETLCKKYAGLKKEDIERIRNSTSRAVMIHTSHPGYVLSEKEIFLT